MRNYLLIVIYFFSFICYSQTGSFSGLVLDKNDNAPLIGVNLVLKNTNQLNVDGTATNLDGEFEFNNIQTGQYELSVSYIGYETITMNINISDKSIVKKNIYLNNTATIIDAIVISAGRFEQKLEEVTVSMDIIKPSLIENKNSTDLEVLMNQSPGVQVVDGQANIRGGSGWSYNTGSRVLVMVDDMPLLSGDRGTVEWNMIPMENISQIEIIKGASSVLFGSSALNGVINVRTAYPKGEPEAKVSLFSGYYDAPKRDGLHWWGDDTRRFHGISFSYAEYKNNTGLVIGGNIYSNDGFKGGYVTDPNGDGLVNNEDSIASNFGEEIPVSEKWGRFNFNTEHNSTRLEGLTYGLNANFMFMKQYQSLIFANDSIAYTPIGVPEGDKPVLFRQLMFNLDPHVKYLDPDNNIRVSYKARFFRDDYKPLTSKKGFSNVFYQEFQFQKTFDKKYGHLVSTTGITSNYIKGDYDDIYGDGGTSSVKQMFNYSTYSQLDVKHKKLNFSFGARLENLIFQEASYLIPVLRTGINYQLLEATYLRGSIGQGYRYPTIMESFVTTSFHPVYVYPGTENGDTLMAESGWSAELGLKQLFKIGEWKGMLDFAGFIMHYNDMIEFTFGQWALPSTPDPADNFYGIGFKCVNIGETRISGAEVSIVGEGKIGSVDVSLLASYTYAHPEILNPNETYFEYENYLGEVEEINYNLFDFRPSANAIGLNLTDTIPYLYGSDGYADGDPNDYIEVPNNPNGASYDNTNHLLKYRHEHLLKFDINLDFKNIMTGLSVRYNSLMKNMDGIFGSGMFNNGGGTDGFTTIIDIGILESRERMLNGDLIIDWRAGVHINENMTISFIIDNILNREYQHRPADLGAPRTFTLKLSAKM